jgi:dienelactone hydrolase
MRITVKRVAVLLLVLQSLSMSVAVGVYAGTLDDDLSFPASPEPFGYGKESKMFKPQGSGPFPALVILPTCAGHLQRHAFDVWAKAALQRGYAVLVVDPLTPRGVTAPGENCRPPSKVREWRLRKDAFDAAEHLRKQPFVDPDRVGLLGLSQGAMAALGVSASLYETPQGQPAFRAIVANYPVCFIGNLRIPGRGPVNVNFVPDEKITVPLLVQMGDLDTEGPPQDCISRLQVQKDKGAPVQLAIYKNATHGWDIGSNFTKTAANGHRVAYRYNPKVTAESVRLAFDFLDSHVRKTEHQQ